MKRPVIVDAEWIRPLTSSDETLHCAKCLQPGARWLVGRHPNTSVWCAHCFLYDTDWGKKEAQSISELVEEVGQQGHLATRDGKVARDDADRILSAIVMVSKMVKARQSGAPRRIT